MSGAAAGAGRLAPRQFEVAAPAGNVLRGDSAGEGPPVVQLHGLTAARRYVVHGSRALERGGHEAIAYDARGHGESDPALPGGGYTYEELTGDLGALLDAVTGERPVVLAGHSMGAHTAAAHALAGDDRLAGLVLICPASLGEALTAEALENWDRLAAGLETGGVEGFVEAYDDGTLDPAWRDVLLRIARERLGLHRDPQAVARALREVPRSQPFDGLGALEGLDVPALVVASRDEADPGHPYAVAEAWSQRLPRARLVSEEPGQSPLAWQGGRLSREISAFCGEPAVAECLDG